MNQLKNIIVSPDTTIAEAIQTLDQTSTGILLVCGPDAHLIGVITDGDIRRAILRSVSFSEPCLHITNKNPVCAPEGISNKDALYMMDNSKPLFVNHLPVVDSERRITDLILRHNLILDDQMPLQAVVMAGGLGERLRPLTEDVPKPMLPVGNKPILEHIINQLYSSGIRKVSIATHYLPDKITNHFKDGRKFGLDISYVNEEKPLGTAGAISLMEPIHAPMLVINGDILTKVDFRYMYNFHRENKAEMTVGVRHFGFKVPYGVVECKGQYICNLVEKPTQHFFINAGIYLLEPTIFHYIPSKKPYNMTDLIEHLIRDGKPVASFPIMEYWLDVGNPMDYAKANGGFLNILGK